MTAKQTNWTLQVYSMYSSLQDEQWACKCTSTVTLSLHTMLCLRQHAKLLM